MPLCVHCARSVDALVAKFGSGHVVLTRCACGSAADPYLEYGPTIVFIDLILAKPRAYRHILYNTSTRYTLPVPEQLDAASPPEWMAAWTYARRFAAVFLMDTYLRWFYLCVHALAADGQGIQWQAVGSTLTAPCARTSAAALMRSAPLWVHGVVRLLGATALEMLAVHGVVSASCALSERWHKRRRVREAHVPVHLASTALLFASVSPLLMLAVLVVWDSRLPLDRRTHAFSVSDMVSEAAAQHGVGSSPLVTALDTLVRGWNTEWVIRNLLGGMNTGIALGVVLPGRAVDAALALVAGSLAQAGVRRALAAYGLYQAAPQSRQTVACFCYGGSL